MPTPPPGHRWGSWNVPFAFLPGLRNSPFTHPLITLYQGLTTFSSMLPSYHWHCYPWDRYLGPCSPISSQIKDQWEGGVFAQYLARNSDHKRYYKRHGPRVRTDELMKKTTTLPICWDTGKAVLQSSILAIATSYKRKVLKQYKEASDCLRHSQIQLSQNNSPDHGEKPRLILICGRKLKERIHQSHLDLQYHKYGNKSGKLLARLCKGHIHTHSYTRYPR